MFISAEHLPGKWNVQAHQESRHYHDPNDWQLNPAVSHVYTGPLSDRSIFQSSEHSAPNFLQLESDPQGWASDALQQNWSQLREEGGGNNPITQCGQLKLDTQYVWKCWCLHRFSFPNLRTDYGIYRGQAQMQCIVQPGINGVAGVVQDKLISFAPLWKI